MRMAIATPSPVPSRWELAAETIAVKIRWFGLVMGYLLVNVTGRGDPYQPILNAMQRELIAGLGTVGATQVRFLFGFPFALVFLAVLLAVTGTPLPRPGIYSV